MICDKPSFRVLAAQVRLMTRDVLRRPGQMLSLRIRRSQVAWAPTLLNATTPPLSGRTQTAENHLSSG